MKKTFFTIFLIFIFAGCDKEDGSDCFQTAGKMVNKEVELPAFEEIIVYGGVKLYIEQGEEQKVLLKSGENLMNEVTAEVENGRLSLRNGNACNFFREYDLTSVHVTVPNLTWLQNAGNNTIESVGELRFTDIWLRSFNQEKDPEIYTNGDFDLHLISDYVRITSDNYSNFFLTGETRYFDVYIADGDTRLEAAGFPADIVEIQHRGTNKLIVHPLQTIKGEIRSTGDVISVRRPENVRIETFYSGKLIFE